MADFGTSRAVLAVGSNIDIDVRPPHKHTCERLHADYSDVRQVEHVEDSSTKFESRRSTPAFYVISVWVFG